MEESVYVGEKLWIERIHTEYWNKAPDMTFTVGPQIRKVQADEIVISNRSEVIAVTRRYSDKDSTIHIPRTNPESFGHFLKYLYTETLDPADIPMKTCLGVLSLAHTYHVLKGIICKCSMNLISILDVSNCVPIYQFARCYQEEESQLFEASFKLVTSNFQTVLKSPDFMELDENALGQLLQSDDLLVDETDLFQAVLKWSDHTGENLPPALSTGSKVWKSRKEHLQFLLSLIRFPLMGIYDFVKLVVPTKVLPDQAVVDMIMHFNGHVGVELKCSSKPRLRGSTLALPVQKLPSHLKSLKCFELETTCSLSDLVAQLGDSSNDTVLGLPAANNLRFVVHANDAQLTILGVRFYRVRPSSFKQTSATNDFEPSLLPSTEDFRILFGYDMSVKIFKVAPRGARIRVLKRKAAAIKASEGKEVDMLMQFDTPIKIKVESGSPYLISTSLKIYTIK